MQTTKVKRRYKNAVLSRATIFLDENISYRNSEKMSVGKYYRSDLCRVSGRSESRSCEIR